MAASRRSTRAVAIAVPPRRVRPPGWARPRDAATAAAGGRGRATGRVDAADQVAGPLASLRRPHSADPPRAAPLRRRSRLAHRATFEREEAMGRAPVALALLAGCAGRRPAEEAVPGLRAGMTPEQVAVV